MNPKPWLPAVLILLCVGAGLTGLILLGRENVRLGRRIAELRRQNERNDGLPTPAMSLAPAAVSGRDAAGSSPAISSELARMREEVAALERNAQLRRMEKLARAATQASADAASLAGSNNPESGLTKLEAFQNLGFNTPAAAFQTLVWAALKGDDDVLTGALEVTGPARERAERLIASLPENVRATATPEKLAALWFARTALGITAAQVAGEAQMNPTHVNLIVRGGFGIDGQVPMQLGVNGWRMVVPEQAMEGAQIKVLGASLPKKGDGP